MRRATFVVVLVSRGSDLLSGQLTGLGQLLRTTTTDFPGNSLVSLGPIHWWTVRYIWSYPPPPSVSVVLSPICRSTTNGYDNNNNNNDNNV